MNLLWTGNCLIYLTLDVNMIFNTKFNNYSLNFIKVLLIAKIEIKGH